MSLKNPTFFAGMFRAAAYAYGVSGSGVDALQVDLPGGVGANTSTQTLSLAFGIITLNDGTILSPLNTNANVTVGLGANADTVTPSAVSNGTPQVYQSSNFTAATYAHAHGTGDPVASATVGLQEAINDCHASGGGIVIVDAGWYQLGGTAGILAAATIPSGVTVTDNHLGGTGIYPILTNTTTLTNAQVLGMQVTPVQLIPAGGANTAIILDQVVLENLNTGTAYANGGAIGAYYGNSNLTYPASTTVAATFLTTPTATAIDVLTGTYTSDLGADAINAAVYISNASAPFITGTGTLKVTVTYRVVGGL
jgi:hypothetical protein